MPQLSPFLSLSLSLSLSLCLSLSPHKGPTADAAMRVTPLIPGQILGIEIESVMNFIPNKLEFDNMT